jgi:hypothetical protein
VSVFSSFMELKIVLYERVLFVLERRIVLCERVLVVSRT